MAEDKIFSLIEKEALAKEREILDAAELELNKTLEGAEAHIRRRQSEARLALESRLSKLKNKLASELALEERRELARVKDALLAKTFQKVKEGLEAFARSKAYPQTLETLCREITDALGTQEKGKTLTFVTREEDNDLVRAWVRREGLAAQVDPHGKMIGGVEARLGSGEVHLVNTFEARLERARHDILSQVAAALGTP